MTTLVGEGVGETDELVVAGAAEDEDEVGGSAGTEKERTENNKNTEVLRPSSLYINTWMWLNAYTVFIDLLGYLFHTE